MTNRREGGDTSCHGRSREAPGLHLERARDCAGGSRSHICIPSQPYEIANNSEKTGGFAHVLASKSPKTPFFALKYLTRYTHKTFFEEYTNFEAHYLSHCRDIPLQSFGSHIRSQPHGLGLISKQYFLNSDSKLSVHDNARNKYKLMGFMVYF